MTRCIYFVCFAFLCTGWGDSAIASDASVPFTFELRFPKTLKIDRVSAVDFVSHGDENGIDFSDCYPSEASNFTILQGQIPIYSEAKPQRGFIVRVYTNPAQVFRLSIPRSLKPTDWSQWQRPDYIEQGDAGWYFFWPDSKAPPRSTNIPPDCFELRYKIERKGAMRPPYRPKGQYNFGFVNKTGRNLEDVTAFYGDQKASSAGDISSRGRVGYSDPLTLPIPGEAELRWNERGASHKAKVELAGVVTNGYERGTIFFVIKTNDVVEVKAIKWGDDEASIKLVK